MADAADGATGWRLDVLSGPNAGAHVPLEGGRYRLGTSIDNDIILAEPAMADHQAVFLLGDDGASFEVAAPGVAAEDGRAFESGEQVAVTGPLALTVGATQIRFTPPRRRRRALPMTLGTVLCVVLVGTIGARMVDAASGAAPPPPAAITKPAAQQAQAVAPTDAAAALQAHMAQAGLPGIALGTGAGAVIATGQLTPEQRPPWMASQMWFDGQYHGNVTLIDQVQVAAVQSGPKFAIRAVSDGDPAYVIDTKGDRYTLGAVVDGGWTIDYIGTDRIVLHKDGREVVENL